MLFRKLAGQELFHARNLWEKAKKPILINGKEYEHAPVDAWGRGYTTHCPICKRRLQKTFLQGWKRGIRKAFVAVHAAQLLHCQKCDTYWSTSMLELQSCGYRCRYD